MSTDIAGKMLTRAIAQNGTLNEAARTVEVCWSTGASVKRYSWDEGYYMEELAVDKAAIRLDRFVVGMSLLDTHEAHTMANRLGTVVPGSVRIESGKAYATVKFSKKPAAEEIWQDLRDGHALQISVGYKIHRYEKTEGGSDALPILRAIDWEPMELSAVPIPADPGAHSRSEDHDMPEQIETTGDRQEAAPTRQVRTDTVRERTRISELRHLARSAQMDDAELDAAIDDGTSVAAFRTAAFERMIAKQNESPTFPHVETTGMNGRDDTRKAMGEAIYARVNPSHTPSAHARQFIGLTLAEMARESLRSAGQNTTGMGASQLIARSLGGLHTTSDFALALGDAVGRVVQASYAAAPSGLKPIARLVELPDFRRRTFIRMSGMSNLERVGEHGEFKRGTIDESGESVKLDTFGKVFGITRQALINDDLGALSDIPRKLGEAAARFESEKLASVLAANAALSDGVALFHATHGNLAGAGAAPSETTLSAARVAMRAQKDDAGFLISVQPKYLVVGPALETAAEKLLATISATTTNDVQPIKLSLVVEPRIVGNGWYVVDPAADGLVYAHLAGEPGPQIESRSGFDVDGVETRVRLDFGAAFADFRGWYRNAGA